MDRIINGNVVDVMEDNRNGEWKVNRRETVICFCNVDWLSRYNDDWLSEYGRSPWHYSKVRSFLFGCAVEKVYGWLMCLNVPRVYVPWGFRYADSSKEV